MTTNTTNVFVQRVEAFFSNLGLEFTKWGNAFLPKLEHTLEVAFEDLAEIAGKAVFEEAQKAISGQEKFGNAVTNLIQTVEANGKTVAINVAHSAIQNAFQTAQDLVLNR